MVEVKEKVSIGERLKDEEFNTQRDAYRRFCERDEEGTQAQKVFAAICLCGEDGATIYDIQGVTGFKIASILGRLDELKDVRPNARIFVDEHKRLNEASNCYNTVYKAVRYDNDLWFQVCKVMGWRA